ncbi:MAG: GNAT family N-acetyltransferase, partial [Micromonosporaceae bacterium]
IRGLGGDTVPLRRVGPEDVDDILAVVRGVHATARTSGPIDWEATQARTWLTEDAPFAYLADDGFLAYHWEGRNLEVDELVAGSGETARALWSLVGSGSSVAETVRACVGPSDPLHWLTQEEVVRQYDQKHWMLRLIDVPAALSGRGYPAGVDSELTVSIEDPHLPANSGTWRLTVAQGAGKAERASGGGLRLGPNGLAALYAGTPVTSLRTLGLATDGDPDIDPLYDTVFGAQPYLLDYF